MQGQPEFLALTKSGVGVSLDGYRVTAPPGVVDQNGFADLTRALQQGKKPSK